MANPPRQERREATRNRSGGTTVLPDRLAPGPSARAWVVFRPVRILVLGGTSFVGRAIVADALRAGAQVTLFGRGKTGAGLFPELTRLVGDRDTGDYRALSAGSWNAVVDVSGYVPRHVGQAMDALGDRVGRYLIHLQPRRLPARRGRAGLDRGHPPPPAGA